MFKSAKKSLLICLLSLSLFSCGDEGDTGKISLSIAPERPNVFREGITIVIPADDPTDNDTHISVQGPWFSFQMQITNKSERTITIVMARGTATGRKDNSPTEGSFAFDPGEPPLSRLFIAEIPPGGTSGIDNLTLYFQGLPESDNLNYQIELELAGWFGTYTSPEKSFNRSYFFSVGP